MIKKHSSVSGAQASAEDESGHKETRSITPPPLGDLALFVVVFGISWAGCVTFAWRFEGLPEETRPWFRTAIWCLAAAIWVWWRKPRRPLDWLGLTPLSAGIVAVSVVAFVVIFAWNLLRVQLIDGAVGGLRTFAVGGYVWGFVGVFVEELFFRGVVQTQLAERFSTPIAIIVSAALFLAIHVPGWIILSIPIHAVVVASVFLLGLVCGWLRSRSGSLWPAVGAHWANNLGAML
ncbi:MAG TPA: type II CAAX endopeptidase family protein [Rhizomicrobium sp.]|nr:type II CAAX endopeptidase family protein [Rhizomicrobium sp.]